MDNHNSARLLSRRCAVVVLVMIAVAKPTHADVNAEHAGGPLTDDAIVSAWRVLRTVDCARCHGKDYEGLAAPSIVDYARTRSREMFVRMVLDGDLSRGMPAYRDNSLIAEHIDDIYRYFLGRADGAIRTDPRPPRP
ncbi:c-type cytochrome [Paraburkholderia sp. HD33-4]|uniref:c-type cytochrome n=1 Tax=Paraburkholderia sp. HD33-4 TaxID=2883242 RepID=UPI001F21132B|nr:cytochrome c [Paraburkholderia sp. HD33-4]